MNKTFKDFTGLYSLSKTLRFELKPIGQTTENIEKCKFLESDKKTADDYKEVKTIIENYHKFFIDDVLKDASFDWTLLEKEMSDFQKNKIDDTKIGAEQKKLRDQLAKKLADDKRFKALTAATPSDLFNKDKDFTDWFEQSSLDTIRKEVLDTFKKFSSYFTGFQENRKNVYSSEAIPTAVPYRLVNDNIFAEHRSF